MIKEFITIYTTNNPGEAQLVKSLLNANGIECTIFDENMATTFEFNIMVGFIKLKILKSDYEDAKSILIEKEYIKEFDPTDNLAVDPCPECGSRKVTKKRSGIGFKIISLLFFFIPTILTKKIYKCRSCDYSWKSKITFDHFFFAFLIGIFNLLFWLVSIFNIRDMLMSV